MKIFMDLSETVGDPKKYFYMTQSHSNSVSSNLKYNARGGSEKVLFVAPAIE